MEYPFTKIKELWRVGAMSDSKNLKLHVFVCTNKKENGESCAPKGAADLRNAVKNFCQTGEPSWHGHIRINTAGCLGRCAEGITAVVYPAGKWLTGLKATDSEKIIEACRTEMTAK